MGFHQFSQECYAVHSGHFDIKREHIRLQCHDFIACHVRVRCSSDDLYAVVLTQLSAVYLAHYGGVLLYQNFNLCFKVK